MKTLVLMRHAHSGTMMKSAMDLDRPLSDRGRRDAPRMARKLASRGLQPELVVSSPALRARSTAELVVRELSPNGQAIRIEPALYDASVREYFRVFQALPDQVNTVLVVAHNPTITECAHRLTPDRISEMPAGAVVAVTFDTDSWGDLSGGNGTVLFAEHPVREGDPQKRHV